MFFYLAQWEKIGVSNTSHVSCSSISHFAGGNELKKNWKNGENLLAPAGDVQDADLTKYNAFTEGDKHLRIQIQ